MSAKRPSSPATCFVGVCSEPWTAPRRPGITLCMALVNADSDIAAESPYTASAAPLQWDVTLPVPASDAWAVASSSTGRGLTVASTAPATTFPYITFMLGVPPGIAADVAALPILISSAVDDPDVDPCCGVQALSVSTGLAPPAACFGG